MRAARSAEQRYNGIADELLDRPLMTLRSRPHRFEVTTGDVAQDLGVKGLAEHGRTYQISENNRDAPA